MRPAITKPGNQNRVMQNNTVETLIGAVTRQLEAKGAKRIREMENLR